MKKTILSLILLISITTTTYSQDFYFGVSPGEISPVLSKTENSSFTSGMNDFWFFIGNFNFSVIFKNNSPIMPLA